MFAAARSRHLIPILALVAFGVLAATLPREAARARPSTAELQVQLATRSREGLEPRGVTRKPARTPNAGSNRWLDLKFRQGSVIRLRNGGLTSLANDNLAGVRSVVARHAGLRFERMFDRPELALAAEESRIERLSGREVADQNLWYRVRLPASLRAAAIADEFNALPIVEIAYPSPEPAPLPVTPDFSSEQGYRGLSVNNGIGADAANTLVGGTGALVRIFDLEYSWNTTHEDLSKAAGSLIANGTPVDPFTDTDHGTAVLGEMIADNNGIGVTGLAYGATLRTVNTNTMAGYMPANAVLIARGAASRGDVVLVEQQAVGANGGCNATSQVGCAPMEFIPAFYDQVVLTTALGIYVVEAAGNGTQDLDGAEYNTWTSKPDSGAIIVGAGGSGNCSTARERLGFSNHGARVNLQGWGECVVTTGYGDKNGATQGNDAYTSSFGGTSSASPIVTSAVALYSSVLQNALGDNSAMLPTPATVRSTLAILGSLQVNTNGENIGPLPNLRLALSPYDIVPPTAPTGTMTDLTTGHATYFDGVAAATIVGADNFGVDEYYASTSPTTPGAFDAGWQSGSVVPVSASGPDGLITFYFWTQDAKTNISPMGSGTLTLETVRPRASLNAPTITKKRNVPIAFSGSDATAGVGGYFVSKLGTTPAENDPGWSATPPATFTVPGASGLKTVYGWVKDNAGNMSLRASDTFLFDSKKPVVTVSQPAANSSKKSLTQLRGTANDIPAPAQYKLADFALGKRIGPGQCAWWNPRRGMLQNGPCGSPKRFLIRTAGNTPNWKRDIGTLKVPGNYFLIVRFIDSAGNIGLVKIDKFTLTGPGGPPLLVDGERSPA